MSKLNATLRDLIILLLYVSSKVYLTHHCNSGENSARVAFNKLLLLLLLLLLFFFLKIVLDTFCFQFLLFNISCKILEMKLLLLVINKTVFFLNCT